MSRDSSISTIPKPSEAAALDGALACNASRLMPKVSHAYAQRPFVGPRPDRAEAKKTQGMSPSRQARADEWAAMIEGSGLTLADIARETGIGVGRVNRIVRQGAIPDTAERERLVGALYADRKERGVLHPALGTTSTFVPKPLG